MNTVFCLSRPGSVCAIQHGEKQTTGSSTGISSWPTADTRTFLSFGAFFFSAPSLNLKLWPHRCTAPTTLDCCQRRVCKDPRVVYLGHDPCGGLNSSWILTENQFPQGFLSTQIHVKYIVYIKIRTDKAARIADQ